MCDGDGNAGVGPGDVWLRGVSVWVVHLIQVLCLLPTHARDELGAWVLVAVVLEGVGEWLGPESGKVGWCYVCVCCESGFFVEMECPGIFGAHNVKSCCTLSISAS